MWKCCIIPNVWLCRYELLDDLGPASRGGAADVAKETLEVVMDTIGRILPTDAARLAPPLSKVGNVSVTSSFCHRQHEFPAHDFCSVFVRKPGSKLCWGVYVGGADIAGAAPATGSQRSWLDP